MRTTLRRLLSTLGVLVVTTALTGFSLQSAPASAVEATRLTAVSLPATLITATSSATFAYTLAGDARAVEAVFVNDATGAIMRPRRDVRLDDGPNQTVSMGWSARWPSGRYRLDRVHVIARGTTAPSGPVTTYWADHRVTIDGTPAGTHTLGFAEAGVTVAGAQTGELAPPVLSSMAWKARPSHAGDDLSLTIDVSDQQPILSEAYAYWVDEAGNDVRPLASQVARGQITLTMPAEAGRYQLRAISIIDQASARTQYLRDGSVVHGSPTPEQTILLRGWTRPNSHPFRFSDFDLSVAPPAPYVNNSQVRGAPAAADLAWGHDATRTVTAWRLEAAPGGRSLRLPATLPRNGAGWFTATLTGLTNGTTHTIRIIAESVSGDSRAATVSVTPQMATSVVGLPRLATGGPQLVGMEASPLRQAPGRVRRYNVRKGLIQPGVKDPLQVLRIASGGNITRDGLPQLLGVAADNLVIAHGSSNQVISKGWGTMRWIDGGSDFTGDGWTDVIAVDPTGALRLYPTTGAGKLGSPRTMGTGWGGFRTVFTPGDFNGDRRADVMAVDATGALWLYRGNGSGGWLGRIKVGSGWHTFAAVNAARDFTGDGFEDVLAAQLDGTLKIYPSNGRGQWLPTRTVGKGWQIYF